MITLAVLHPGQMGASLAAAAQSVGEKTGGVRVVWASEGRSATTRARAESEGLEDAGSLAGAVRQADIALSICPPHGARALAADVMAAGFTGIFCDANAVSPATARDVARIVTAAGARYVDGGVVGPPARKPGKTRLYLSGAEAEDVAALFAGSLAEPVVIGTEPGAASALKMAYAGWTKGRTALLLAIRAMARAEGVDDALMAEWARSQPGLQQDIEATGPRVSAKAWRWVGEMEEIADSLAAAGLPDGTHRAAARLYAAMADFKDAETPPDFDAVMAAILAGPSEDG